MTNQLHLARDLVILSLVFKPLCFRFGLVLD
jgi:hypothetical protein